MNCKECSIRYVCDTLFDGECIYVEDVPTEKRVIDCKAPNCIDCEGNDECNMGVYGNIANG